MHINSLWKQFLVSFYSSSGLCMVKVSRIKLKVDSTNMKPLKLQDRDNMYIGFIQYSKYCMY